MTPSELDVALAAANPMTKRTAMMLPLRDAEAELVERIAATPVGRQPPRARARTAARRPLVLALALSAAVAVALMVLPSGDRGGGPAPAFAAPLVRFAQASPLALLQLAGWHVVYADEEPGGYGELHFVRGAANADGTPTGASLRDQASLAGRIASLTWEPVNPVERRYIAGGHQDAATGLGVNVRRFVREGGSRGAFGISALFIEGARELTFRATVTDMAMFGAELRALTSVDTTTWLRAMPPSVVTSADSGETIRAMLKGIPLPPGFDAARIRGARLTHDRYQLGAAVTGTVACMWIADWNRARAAGAAATVRRAVAAMATAPHWPVLREMARGGAWPQVLIEIARALPRGTYFGRPLTADVNSGLGCDEWGVRLGP